MKERSKLQACAYILSLVHEVMQDTRLWYVFLPTPHCPGHGLSFNPNVRTWDVIMALQPSLFFSSPS